MLLIRNRRISTKARMITTPNSRTTFNLQRIIREELRRDNENRIPLETNGFVETHDINEVPLKMVTKQIPYGLLAVFYGEDDYAMAPDPDKPYYVWPYRLNQRETADIERNMVDYAYDSWFDLWFDISERIGSFSPQDEMG